MVIGFLESANNFQKEGFHAYRPLYFPLTIILLGLFFFGKKSPTSVRLVVLQGGMCPASGGGQGSAPISQ